MRELRVALVGAGNVALRRHVPAWLAVAGARVVHVVDPREQAAREAARQLGADRCSEDLEPVLDDSGIDAIDLCTPAELHAEQAIRALESGKHVLVEKPVATTVEDAERMASTAYGSGCVALVAENHVHSPVTRRVRELLAQDRIGTPLLIEARNATPYLVRKFDRPEQSDRDRLGYTFVAGIHTLAVVRHLLGEVTDLAAFANLLDVDTGLGIPYDSELVMACRFQKGTLGSLYFTAHSHDPVYGASYRIFGSSGELSFDIFRREVTEVRDGVQNTRPEPSPSAGFHELIQNFVDAINGMRQPLTPVEDQLETLRLLYRVYEALSPIC